MPCHATPRHAMQHLRHVLGASTLCCDLPAGTALGPAHAATIAEGLLTNKSLRHLVIRTTPTGAGAVGSTGGSTGSTTTSSSSSSSSSSTSTSERYVDHRRAASNSSGTGTGIGNEGLLSLAEALRENHTLETFALG
jgi:hypothetical protein